ncbi:cytochrome C [Rhodosalinus halophilus]|uniref:Cytochrome C n=1 Tax=Rhodosalinus halophilus TaxID=2259333 RepID=A0A365U7F3_9RHOB|nr:cytochrome C [Rhodosalinus halophilus]RBI84653.1 cytochrome C [Rhodosalinus halophilus]
MILRATTLMMAATIAAPALAQDAGDPAEGENLFNRCKACHMIESPDGEMIQRGGRVGPNLYGVVGGPAAQVEDFRYGDGILEAAEMGLEWNQENFVAYTEDPQAFLREYTGNSSARSKMAFKLREGAVDIYAYLMDVAPDESSGES